MPIAQLRILVIGELSPAMHDILRRFSERGWGAQHVRNVQEAKDLLGIFDYDVVLASETLTDGRGYDLADSVAVHSRTLMVGVALSETHLWLPVVERGRNVLGSRGLNDDTMESEMTSLLAAPRRDSARDRVCEIPRSPSYAAARPAPQRSTALRRKYRDRDHLPMRS
jgi:hypothetical protein